MTLGRRWRCASRCINPPIGDAAAAEDDLALLGAHGTITVGFAALCNATRIRRRKSLGYTNNPCSGAFGLRSVTSSPPRSDQQASADDNERAERPPRPPDSADVHVPRVDKHAQTL